MTSHRLIRMRSELETIKYCGMFLACIWAVRQEKIPPTPSYNRDLFNDDIQVIIIATAHHCMTFFSATGDL